MQFTDEQFKKDSEQLIDFIYKSPSPYHVVNNIAAVLNENGFIRLSAVSYTHLTLPTNSLV